MFLADLAKFTKNALKTVECYLIIRFVNTFTHFPIAAVQL